MTESETLDNYVIVKDNRKKFFIYATIRGCARNIKEVLQDLDLDDKNIIFHIQVPSSLNFCKKVRKVLFMVCRRKKVYLLKDQDGKAKDKVFEEKPDDEPPLLDEDEGNECVVSCTRWFLLRDATEETFLGELNEINLARLSN